MIVQEKPIMKREVTSVMVDRDTHHIIKTLAVQRRMKMTDLIRETFSENLKQDK